MLAVAKHHNAVVPYNVTADLSAVRVISLHSGYLISTPLTCRGVIGTNCMLGKPGTDVFMLGPRGHKHRCVLGTVSVATIIRIQVRNQASAKTFSRYKYWYQTSARAQTC